MFPREGLKMKQNPKYILSLFQLLIYAQQATTQSSPFQQ